MRTLLSSLATIFPMSLYVLPRTIVPASVGTRHRELGARDLVALQGVGREGPDAVVAADESLAARVDLVGLEPVSRHSLPTFVLAVEKFKSAHCLMFLDHRSSEGPLTVTTVDRPIDACERLVVLHHHPRDLGSALIWTAHGVLLTRVEMRC